MGFGGGTHRGQGALPVNLDTLGNATIPLGRMTRSASARVKATSPHHGSAELGPSRRRERSNDRRQNGPLSPGDYRFNTAGPEEAKDWTHALQSVVDRVATLERSQRSQTETMVRIEATQRQLGEHHGIFSATLSQLKDRDKIIVDQFQQVQTNFKYTDETFKKWEQRIKEIEGCLQTVLGNVSELASKLHAAGQNSGQQQGPHNAAPDSGQNQSPQAPSLGSPFGAALSSPPRATLQ